MIYLDTSALAKLYLPEPGAEEIAKRVSSQDKPLPYTSLHELELTSALERRAATHDLSRDAVKRVTRAIEADLRNRVLTRTELDWPAVFASALPLLRRHARIGLRTLDGLHLACALQLDCRPLVTCDQAQAKAAALEGIASAERSDRSPP